VNKAAIISYSPIIAEGSQSKHIIVTSKDGTGQGIVILNSDPSAFTYVDFSNLSSLSYGNWNLTGAITFYESDVKMDHCTFASNSSEDALNFIRNKFEISDCKFEQTKSDALDGDFTHGTVSNCIFDQIGNDAIDFSGSNVTIVNTKVLQAGDKGISGGEASTLQIKNCTIQNANIGVASKDQSKISLTGTTFESCNYFVASFKKKHEYGGAFVEIDTEIPRDKLIVDKHSSISMGEKEISGVQEIDIDSMYQAYSK